MRASGVDVVDNDEKKAELGRYCYGGKANRSAFHCGLQRIARRHLAKRRRQRPRGCHLPVDRPIDALCQKRPPVQGLSPVPRDPAHDGLFERGNRSDLGTETDKPE